MEVKQTIRKLANIATYTSAGAILGGIALIIVGATSLGSVLVLLGVYSLPITLVLVVLSALTGAGVPQGVAGLIGFLGAASIAVARGVGYGLANAEFGDDEPVDKYSPGLEVALNLDTDEYEVVGLGGIYNSDVMERHGL